MMRIDSLRGDTYAVETDEVGNPIECNGGFQIQTHIRSIYTAVNCKS